MKNPLFKKNLFWERKFFERNFFQCISLTSFWNRSYLSKNKLSFWILNHLLEIEIYYNEKICSKEISFFPKVILRDYDLITHYDWPTTSLQQVQIYRHVTQYAGHSKSIRPVSSYATLRRWRTDPHRFAPHHSFGAHRAALQMYHRFFQLRVYWSNGFTVALAHLVIWEFN